MLSNGNSVLRNVNGITETEKKDIQLFLQGAVYCWCKNRNKDWFSLRDLMGGENFYWQGTPLYALYEKQEKIGAEDPIKQAGKDGGWLLKKVISDDKRTFKTKIEGMIRKYKWINSINNEH